MQFTFQSLTLWPTKPTVGRLSSNRFSAGYQNTIDLLEKELRHLGANQVTIEAFLGPDDIRLDGLLRTGAQPRHPGIVMSFNCKQGRLSFPCDRYDDWKANLRAIALSLQALRDVDRHGVSKIGAQYSGYKALPAPGSNGAHFDKRMAIDWLHKLLNVEGGAINELLRQAEIKTHPDKGGNPDDFKTTQDCRKALLG